jgi:DNA repair protein RecN (Recombination protein N)
MLRELRIRDFAIIDELSLSFRPGLNVITGETGAGKSILIQALVFLCGGRAGAEVVRSKAEAASFEGLFEIPEPTAVLPAIGLDADEEILVRRVVPRSGKGRVHVNGSPVTLSQLAQLSSQLVHLYGQHEQTQLLHPANHLALLDGFAHLEEKRVEMAGTYEALAAARKSLRELEQSRETAGERRAVLEFQIQELAAAGVRENEEEDLRREREVLRHASRLLEACREAESALYSGDPATVDTLARLATTLKSLVGIDPSLQEPVDLIESARAQIEEAATTVKTYGDRLRFDPDRLEQIEERLMLLSRLSRKHGVPSAELAAKCRVLEAELAAVEGREAQGTEAAALVAKHTAEALRIAGELSHLRVDAALRLEREMSGELAALGMTHGKFEVSCTAPGEGEAAAALTATGFDTVEFYLSPNAGEPPRPLARTASGGELSRVMLALKALTASAAESPILLFDEVDAGIGGTVADAVARRLKLLARNHQLLCITHLPQIAAYADHHFAVEKTTAGGRTTTTARMLGTEGRVAELSRMLGGTVAPEEAQRYARRLIAEGQAASFLLTSREGAS